jgi:hypothetical protein
MHAPSPCCGTNVDGATARRRDGAAAAVIAEDVRAIRSTGHESATARLLVAATVEVADRELHRRRRLPELRSALLDLA